MSDSDQASVHSDSDVDAPMPASMEVDPPQVDPNDPNSVILEKGNIVKKILKAGEDGKRPPLGSEVRVHYVGRLLDGAEFDSSRGRNEEFKFKLGAGQVIKGWDKGVASMNRGELAELTIKPEYAYGKNGSPPKIPADATLKFEVELIDWEHRVKVSDDGGIMKEVLKEGEGYNKPNDNATVTIRYSARIDNVKSSADEKQPFGELVIKPHQEVTINMGEDLDMLAGMDQCLKHMLKGEKSVFFVKPKYGYGASGHAGLKIPPQAHLVYEIELLDFSKGMETWQMNFEQKLEAATHKKDQGNTLFKADRVQEALARYDGAIRFFQYEGSLEEDQKTRVKNLKVTAHSNKAACKHKLGDHAGVVADATEALKLDGNHSKSLFRRAQGYIRLKEPEKAEQDLVKLKQLDANYPEVDKLLASVKATLKAQLDKERKLFAGVFDKVKLVDESESATNKSSKKPAAAEPVAPMDTDDEQEVPASTSTAAASEAPMDTTAAV